MKKFIYISFVLLSVLFSCGPKGNTLKEEISDFKIDDTSTVDKIFLADKMNNTVLLTKESSNRWIVNNKFPARPDMIQNLLICIKKVEVKQYVPKPAIENVIKHLSVSATKVEIYQKGKLSKTYYVGGPTQDHFGTYMLMEGAEIPFICYMPGFRGYITSYYIPMEVEWKDRKIFSHEIPEIQSVRVEHFRQPEESWEITNIDNANFQLKALKTGQEIKGFDTTKVKELLKNFKVTGFEGFADVNSARMDSVKAKYGLYRVSLTDRSGRTKFVDLYEIPLPPGTLDMLGRPALVDVDRMYGLVDGETITICQYYTFDPITVPLSYFTSKEGLILRL